MTTELPELRPAARVFGPEAGAFLADLTSDNSREFFTTNRARYDEHVRGPLEALLARAEARWGSGRVMRQNRDLRFSADRSPYRTFATMSAGSGPGGAFLQLSADDLQVGGGLYGPSRDQVARARAVIDRGGSTAAALQRLFDDLTADGFEFAGPSLRTAPRGHRRDDPHIELLRLQHYAAATHLPTTAPLRRIEQAWERVGPLLDWIDRHIGPADP